MDRDRVLRTLAFSQILWLLAARPLTTTTSFPFLNSLLSGKQSEALSAGACHHSFQSSVLRCTEQPWILPCGHRIKIQMVLVWNPSLSRVCLFYRWEKEAVLFRAESVSKHQHRCSTTKHPPSHTHQTSGLCQIFQATSFPAYSQHGSPFLQLYLYFTTL